MAQAARSSQEYWRPANPDVARLIEPTPIGAACWRCGMEYSPAARFCHICGSSRERESRVTFPPSASARVSRVRSLASRLGLSPVSLAFFLVGAICLVAALVTGAIYKTDTLVDWQAVQLWRIEWLLAASAAMLAGILLKRNTDR